MTGQIIGMLPIVWNTDTHPHIQIHSNTHSKDYWKGMVNGTWLIPHRLLQYIYIYIYVHTNVCSVRWTVNGVSKSWFSFCPFTYILILIFHEYLYTRIAEWVNETLNYLYMWIVNVDLGGCYMYFFFSWYIFAYISVSLIFLQFPFNLFLGKLSKVFNFV